MFAHLTHDHVHNATHHAEVWVVLCAATILLGLWVAKLYRTRRPRRR